MSKDQTTSNNLVTTDSVSTTEVITDLTTTIPVTDVVDKNILALKTVIFQAGDTLLDSTANAQEFIATNKADVVAKDQLIGNILYQGSGNITVNGGLDGSVDFAGNNGTLNLPDGQTITGRVDSTNRALSN